MKTYSSKESRAVTLPKGKVWRNVAHLGQKPRWAIVDAPKGWGKEER